ncbi:MAG TPA: hypothetical protein VIL35_10165 [Vicinamibacterales bacterium]
MLTLIYIVLAVVGGGYVAVALAIGQLFDTDAALAADRHDGLPSGFHFPFFSATALATLGGSVGAIGLIAKLGAAMPDAVSLLVALPGGLVFSYIVTYVAWRLAGPHR